MRVADYIALRLADAGLSHVFMVTGGGAMHLNDAFGRQKRLATVCFHHEQGCAMAADGYARLGGKAAILNVTTGPGGINALNGVFGAYTDSLPMIVVSGQVRRETIAGNFPIGLRQLGDQEVDIVRMVDGITKYAVTVQDASRIRYELELAIHLATSGRPGPVWIDVPIDIQGSQVDPETLEGFDPATGQDRIAAITPTEAGALDGDALRQAARQVVELLRGAERPCILPGTGVRIAGCADLFLDVAARIGAPVATAFNAHDLMANDHPLYAGRPGTVGDRPGNFAVQNADFLLVLGCRLNIRQISYNWDSFARAAHVAMVDIDRAELAKPTLSIDLPIHADLTAFLTVLREELAGYQRPAAHADYVAWCRERLARYPVVLPDYRKNTGTLNPYCFADSLFGAITDDDVVVTGDGTACVVTFQAADIKAGQRLFSNSGSASMGYDVPAAIGAYYANSGRRVISLAGDGSIMMNLQELQTIAGLGLPVKVFVLNNNGYLSIRQTQENYFPDSIIGCGPESGVTFPDFVKLGAALGFGVRRIEHPGDLDRGIAATLAAEGPQLCEVMLDPGQGFAPKLSSRKLADGRMVTSPLEDMAPFLSREELAENMVIPLLEP
ncbi:thiamine pyrophosphate-binding protein [Emcibacter sp. SYSU 3D8]|uniref:thiamine pyrophosphate-binding protein n=1 Tax=Emcibacter sp. SYSU 3D8 TaxID=3133969 RepID=UPI0031FED48A